MNEKSDPGSVLLHHPFGPLYSPESHTLILGSFPSVKSRQQQFFYGHPQNRFWKVTAAVFGCDVPLSVEDKKRLILDHHLALWDTIASCDHTVMIPMYHGVDSLNVAAASALAFWELTK